LVLTEQGTGQQQAFHDSVPAGARLRIFGTVPPVPRPATGNREADARAAVTATPADLIPSGATNYRRWTNHSWAVIEEGGQARAGEWTNAEASRLEAVVSRAHKMGLWTPSARDGARRSTPASISSPAINTRSSRRN
jgi:hypothetical protein